MKVSGNPLSVKNVTGYTTLHVARPDAHTANINLLGTSVLWHGNLQAHNSKELLTWVPDEGW